MPHVLKCCTGAPGSLLLLGFPGIVQVAGDAGVGSEVGAGGAMQRLLEEVRRGNALGKGKRVRAKFGLGVEEDSFVDEILGEEASVEAGAALEQEVEDVAGCECFEDCGEADMAGFLFGDDLDFRSGFADGFNFFERRGGRGEDQEV